MIELKRRGDWLKFKSLEIFFLEVMVAFRDNICEDTT